MFESREERKVKRNTKKMNSIMRKYDKIKGNYTVSEKAEEYLQKKMPLLKELMKNAQLDEIIFKGAHYESINYGEDFEVDYKSADSALTWAIRNDKFDLVKEFLDMGANFNRLVLVRSIHNYSIGAQDTALRDASSEMLKFLFDYGVKFDEYHTKMLKEWKKYPQQKANIQEPQIQQQKAKAPQKAQEKDDLTQ